MSRVTAVEVKQIIETELDDAVIDAYIASASALVDEALRSEALSETLLKEIERWLTAHLLAISRERQPEQASAGPTSIKYQGMSGLGLDASLYGQQVKLLDTSGKLAELAGVRKAGMWVIKGV